MSSTLHRWVPRVTDVGSGDRTRSFMETRVSPSPPSTGSIPDGQRWGRVSGPVDSIWAEGGRIETGLSAFRTRPTISHSYPCSLSGPYDHRSLKLGSHHPPLPFPCQQGFPPNLHSGFFVFTLVHLLSSLALSLSRFMSMGLDGA